LVSVRQWEFSVHSNLGEDTRQKISDTVKQGKKFVSDKVADTVERGKQFVSDKVADTVSKVTDTARDKIDSVAERLTSNASSVAFLAQRRRVPRRALSG
jgi:gas vesicle protein